MRHLTRSISVLAVLSLLFCLFPVRAHAYLDPGAGSYILQMVLAAILGIGVAIRLSWGRIKSFVGKLRSKGKENQKDED